jgi:hypothetical protein
MALVSQLVAPEQFVRLSKTEVEHIWSLAYAKILSSPDLIEQLRSDVNEKALPHVGKGGAGE